MRRRCAAVSRHVRCAPEGGQQGAGPEAACVRVCAEMEVDVHPEWFQILVKGHNLLLHTPAEVHPDRARVQRRPHDGHLLLTLPLVHPETRTRAAPSKPEAPAAGAVGAAVTAVGAPSRPLKYERDRARVTYRNIVRKEVLHAVPCTACAFTPRARARRIPPPLLWTCAPCV